VNYPVTSWLVGLAIFLELGPSTLLTRDLVAIPGVTRVYLTNSLFNKGAALMPTLSLMPVLMPALAPACDPKIGLALIWGVLFLAGSLGFGFFLGSS
jgi:hypothetical protein